MLCLCAARLKFWFQTDLGHENSASCYRQGNLRSGPIWAVLIHFLLRLPLKLGLIQTIIVCARYGQILAVTLIGCCHKIWLAVGNAGSWKRLFLAWLFSWMIRRRRREGSNLLSFLLFYGLMVGKHVPWKFRKFIWLFISSQDLLYLRKVSVSRSWIPLQVVDC